MKIIGKEPINPLLFYSGKFSGYIIWALLLLSLINTHSFNEINLQRWVAIVFLCAGLIFSIMSIINLGKSTRLGIPLEKTEFKTNGIYKISRNPMYLGFNMLSVAAILYLNHFLVLIMGVFSIFVYHQIIIGEEKFLESRFSDEYLEYKKKVRRYI